MQIEFNFKIALENKPIEEIRAGTWFTGNPKSPCFNLPFYSGSTGQNLYIKLSDGGVATLGGTTWGPMTRMIVENYHEINNVLVKEIL
jgi:hypothetical protein